MALQDDGHGNADAHRSDQLEKRITQLEAMLVLSKDQLQACRSIQTDSPRQYAALPRLQ